MRGRSNVALEPKGSAHLFAALGDETRLRLVSRLCDGGPMSITRLTEGSNVTRQAIAKHLRVMEGSGIVRGARHGRESVWQLDRRRLEDARRYLDAISKHWDDALSRLRAADTTLLLTQCLHRIHPACPQGGNKTGD
jgi:DNA-binding transcriptional ArsR family regulator